MLNLLEFISRLQEIMTKKQLTAAAFAAQIGVQRSSVSHILAQRNKPSLEFILKIHYAFEDIDLTWLLLGQTVSASDEMPNIRSNFDPPTFVKKETEPVTAIENTSPFLKEGNTEIEAIITLFKNGRFKKYSP